MNSNSANDRALISHLTMQGSSTDYTTAAAIAALLKRERSNAAIAAALKRQSEFGPRTILQQNIPGLQGLPNTNFMSSLALHGIRELLGVADERNFSLPSAVDPILLANAIAAERQNKLAEAAQQKARMTDAYQRGREEALLTLVRSGALDTMALQRAAAYQQAQSAPQLSNIAASSFQSDGMLTLLQEASSPVRKNLVDHNDVPAIVGVQDVDRRKTAPSYFDASALQDPDAASLANRRTRGGVTEPFPEKLHRMLKEVEASNETDILSFFPHGRAFAVHNPTRFVSEVMPKYFRQSRLSSFQRQLNLCKFFQ
jgi:hypothetical protein